MVPGRQQGADVALEHEVRAVAELDRLGDLGVGGVDQLADLAADGLLPVGQGVDVGVDAWVGGVGHGRPTIPPSQRSVSASRPRVTCGTPVRCLAALPAATPAPILGWSGAGDARGAPKCPGCGAERETGGDPAWRTRLCGLGGVPPCAGRAAVRFRSSRRPATRSSVPCTGPARTATCAGTRTPTGWKRQRRSWRRREPAVQPLTRSRCWSRSWAASSTCLWRHSAARYWQAIRPMRWTRRKSP
jgi:hypothetical protein